MALIKTINELRPYLPVAYASKIDLLPGFETAEIEYLVPVLGNALYQALSTAYDNDSLTPAFLALLPYCRAVIAPIAFLDNLPFIQTLITNNGLIALETDNSRKA